MRPYLERAEREGRFGVVAIVSAQEFQWVFGGRNQFEKEPGPGVWFKFDKAERRVGVYYFYVLDPEFGPGFIKICTYFPYPAKVWLNGHEWAKRQASRVGIAFTPLSNGFASCEEPSRLQALCDRFGPGDVQAFFDRWMAVIPTPLAQSDRAAGYWWELSMRQVEVSRTLVFDDPRRARRFFEALVADNIDVGRPEQVAIVFARQVRKTTKEPFRSRIFTTGSDVKIDFAYKHSRVKQYLKDGRALRIEAVINKPRDLGVLARLEHLPELVAKARAVNRRLLIIERAGQDCAIGNALFERIHQPYAREGQRTGAFRFGDPRATALAGALATTLHAVTGFTNKSLRGHVAGHLGQEYTPSPDELRPPPPPPPRPHPTRPRPQHLHPDPRRDPRRRLLHQAPKPAPAAPPRRRQATRPARRPPRPRDPRTRRQRLRHSRPTHPSSRMKKLVTTSHVPGTKKD